MKKKILLWIIERLYRFTYEPTTLDKLNQRMIRPVPGLVIDGVQYWEFVNIADMPESRRANYMNARKRMMMGIDDAMLLEFIANIRQANDKGETSRVGSLVFMLEDIIKTITPVENVYYLASIVYFDPKEDLKTYDLDFANKKIEKFKGLYDHSFFFLRLLSNDSKSIGEQQLQDILSSLAEGEVKLKAYGRILSGSQSSKDTDSTRR